MTHASIISSCLDQCMAHPHTARIAFRPLAFTPMPGAYSRRGCMRTSFKFHAWSAAHMQVDLCVCVGAMVSYATFTGCSGVLCECFKIFFLIYLWYWCVRAYLRTLTHSFTHSNAYIHAGVCVCVCVCVGYACIHVCLYGLCIYACVCLYSVYRNISNDLYAYLPSSEKEKVYDKQIYIFDNPFRKKEVSDMVMTCFRNILIHL